MSRLTTVLLMGVLLCQAVFAQAPPKTFEVASIKINKSGDIGTKLDLLPGSGRVGVANMPLRALIQLAYRIRPSQLENVPAWVATTRVDIIAKADPSTSVDDLRTMLQPLFEERLKFTFHRETRESQSLVLVMANKDGSLGPRLKRSAADCAAQAAAPRNAPVDPKAPRCGIIPSGPGHMVLTGMQMQGFTGLLSIAAQGQVLDQTGLAGGFDIDLQYTPEAFSAAAIALRGGVPPQGPAAAVDPDGPSLETALRDQLGLRLEKRTVSLDVMVIDRIEPPTED